MTEPCAAPGRHPGALAASFRDPAGFLFEINGRLVRAVHPDAQASIAALFSSGLHDELTTAGLLVGHDVLPATEVAALGLPAGWMALTPRLRVPVISYACEWTDGQLRDAALLTLHIQRRALAKGFSLKDASAFNVQFQGSRPVFIDILSFETLPPVRYWVAYRQFCEHFLAPLAWRRYLPGQQAQAAAQLHGIALPEAAKALPLRSWLKPGVALHLHLHARAAAGRKALPAGDVPAQDAAAASASPRRYLLDLATSLEHAVQSLVSPLTESAWSGYRADNTYTDVTAQAKLAFVRKVASSCRAARALDLGANDGHYAHALAQLGVPCTAVERDPACSELLHQANLASPFPELLNTLRVDLTNPTPAHGWAHAERASFAERLHCDLVLALALTHHLSITGQVPFSHIAREMASLGRHVVIEYVPIQDPMSQQLLRARSGVTDAYRTSLSEASFCAAFDADFVCHERLELVPGGRVLFHFERRQA